MRNAKKMGRKGNWFSTVKKALSPESKERKNQVWIKLIFNLSQFSMIFLIVLSTAFSETEYIKEEMVWKAKIADFRLILGS